MMIRKIVSGAQTGADRAALDAAMELCVPHGGWVPRGRLAEDGPVPERYLVQEMSSTAYTRRTEQNVIDSDGTVIFTHGRPRGGSLKTVSFTRKHKKPCLHLDMMELSVPEAAQRVLSWSRSNGVSVLNVAGQRASQDPAIYGKVREVLRLVFSHEGTFS